MFSISILFSDVTKCHEINGVKKIECEREGHVLIISPLRGYHLQTLFTTYKHVTQKIVRWYGNWYWNPEAFDVLDRH